MAFNDYWKTWKATLPQTGAGSEYELPGMSIAEAPLSNKGMLKAVTSFENRSKGVMLQSVFTRGNGSHSRTIAKGKYQQRRVTTDIGSAIPASYCSAVASPTWLDFEQEIGAPISETITIRDTDLLDVAGYDPITFQNFFIRQVKDAIEAIHTKLEARLISDFNVLRGINLTNGLTTPVPAQAFVSGATYVPNRAAGVVISNEFRKQQYAGDVIAVGDEIFVNYVDIAGQPRVMPSGAQLVTAQNDFLNDAGLAMSRSLRGMIAYDSAHLDAVLGTSGNVFAWVPGAFQMLEAFDFAHPEFKKDSDTYKKGIMTFNYGGIALDFDYVAKYEECTTADMGWTFTFTKKIGTFMFPKTDQYQATDPLFETNRAATFALTAGA